MLRYWLLFIVMLFHLSSQAICWKLPDSLTLVQYKKGPATYKKGQLMAPIAPGDTLLLLTGCHKPFKLKGIEGTAAKPIFLLAQDFAMICGDSLSAYGISMERCRHLVLNGFIPESFEAPDMLPQIIDIGRGAGISIDQFSSDIEVAWFNIAFVHTSGIMVKTDPTCENWEEYKNFVMRNIHIHHCGIKHTGNEGMYIGNTGYREGSGKWLHCKTDSIRVFPHLIVGIDIHDNNVEHCGWDGIQVASGAAVSVHDNFVVNTSEAGKKDQMSGIMIGEPCRASVYNNYIIYPAGPGIVCLGEAVQIYNNLIHFPIHASQEFPGIYVNDKILMSKSIKADTVLVAFNSLISVSAADSLYFIKIERHYSSPYYFQEANLFVFDPTHLLEHEYRLNQIETYTQQADATLADRQKWLRLFPSLSKDMRNEARQFQLPVRAGCFR